MLSMEVIYLEDIIFPVVPETFSSDPESRLCADSVKKRRSYQLLSVVLEVQGLSIDEKLLGSDDKENV